MATGHFGKLKNLEVASLIIKNSKRWRSADRKFENLNLRNFMYLMLILCCKDGYWEIMRNIQMESTKSWIRTSYLSKHIKWKFGKS